MKYFVIAVLLTVFVGCGGSGKEDSPPTSPQSKDSKNIPPSIPKI